MPAKINSDIKLGVIKSGSTVTDLKNIRNVTPPQESVAQVDTTVYSSVYAESEAGLPDGGEVTVELLFDPSDADHKWLRDNVGKTFEWEVEIPGTAEGSSLVIEFTGYILSWSPNLNARGEALTSSFGIKVSGAPTYTYDAGA